MRWTTARGPTLTSGLASVRSPRATAYGSTEHEPVCAGPFPQAGAILDLAEKQLEPAPEQGCPGGARLAQGCEYSQLSGVLCGGQFSTPSATSWPGRSPRWPGAGTGWNCGASSSGSTRRPSSPSPSA
eukprot:12889842-Alexandrium_andersonii.AAC.1